MKRHEIPTHLDIEDKVVYGLSSRQLMYRMAGASCGYALWGQLSCLSLPVRAAAVGVLALVAIAVALVRPMGRGLDEWLFVVVHYLALPRITTWEPRQLHASITEQKSVEYTPLSKVVGQVSLTRAPSRGHRSGRTITTEGRR